MRTLTLFILLLILAAGGLAALNWTALAQPGSLSLGLIQVQAPLGLVMLGLLAVVALYFLLLLASQQSQAVLAARRNAKELAALREQADKAEASRLAELRMLIENGLRQQGERQQEATAAVVARLDRLEADLREALKTGENSLAAHLGEIEDRVERGFGGTPAPEGR